MIESYWRWSKQSDTLSFGCLFSACWRSETSDMVHINPCRVSVGKREKVLNDDIRGASE